MRFSYSTQCTKSKGKSVLVIGSGLSAEDIVDHLTATAERITHSRFKRPNQHQFSNKVNFRNEVESFSQSGAKFIDGSAHETFDKVIFATGNNLPKSNQREI